MKKIFCALLLFCSLVGRAWAFTPFVISDIRVEGLQRISAGTVFNYLPLKVGEKFDDERSGQAIRALFKTGFFKDVRIDRQGTVLVVVVKERPSIDSVSITGNKSISKEQLTAGLKRVGLAEGRTFKQSLLDQVEQELQRQYFSEGKYAVKIDTKVTPLERNRVAISLDISEGRSAKIREINIVGNKVFKTKDLLEQFQLSTPTTLSWYTGNDQYSKQKLAADLETLRSYYLDRGYLNFDINSTQVSISPNKKFIYITVNITEGDKYTVKDIKVAGNLVVPVKELEKLIQIAPGDTYSRKRITDTTTKITDKLGDVGYAFANVNTIPEIDKKTKQVSLTFFVDPGKRVYVRRVNVIGNTRTSDEVIRREMRQMEGTWFSSSKVKRSRERLERLGYFTSVNVETPPVAGSTDEVDVNFTVVEKPSGNFLASIGYSQTGGVLFSTSVQQDNFLGTGKRVGVYFDNSSISTGFRINYDNPYYTVDGVSRGFTVASQKTDAAAANISNYSTDINQLSMNYGIPINEYDRIRFDIGYKGTKVNTVSTTPVEIASYVATNGDQFGTITVGASWAHDTRNRALFADNGVLHSAGAEISIPGSDVEYFKLNYRYQRYTQLSRKMTLLIKGELGYGDGYGSTKELPFFENFFAGGVQSVRGYKDNTLGPRGHDGSGNVLNALGGSFKVTGGAEVFFTPPFAKESKQFRMGVFLDAGNVFAKVTDFKANQLRFSTGVSAVWISPIGPLSLSLARPLNKKPGDETQALQFSLGGTFY